MSLPASGSIEPHWCSKLGDMNRLPVHPPSNWEIRPINYTYGPKRLLILKKKSGYFGCNCIGQGPEITFKNPIYYFGG
jgi:hypothetical protein